MGNDPGKPVKDKEKSRVFIDITGPFNPDDAKAFKAALDKLISDWRPKCASITVPIKKA